MADITTKYDLPYPENTDFVADGAQAIQDLAEAVDDGFAGYSEATLASRPTSTGGTPGIAGRIFRPTNKSGRYDVDHGTGWDMLLSAAKLLAPWQTIAEASSAFNDSMGAGLYVMRHGGLLSDDGAPATAPPALFYFDPADYAIDGLTTKVRLHAVITTNGTSPATDFQVRAIKLALSGGGADTQSITLGTDLFASDATATPGVNDAKRAAGAATTAPATASFYVFCVQFAPGIASNAYGTVNVRAELNRT